MNGSTMRQGANWTEGHQIQNGFKKRKWNRMVFNGRYIPKMAYLLTKAKQNRFEIEKKCSKKAQLQRPKYLYS